MTCHTTTHAKPRSSSLDIVTYRYNDKLVYVPISPNYDQAITHARDAFPQLKRHRDASLSLSLTAPSPTCDRGSAKKPVGISPAAWPKLITHMTRYQVIDVHLAQESDSAQTRTQTSLRIPDITITYADADAEANADADGATRCRDAETASVPPPPAYVADAKDAHVSTLNEDEKAGFRGEEGASIPMRSRTPSLQSKRSWFFQKLHGHLL